MTISSRLMLIVVVSLISTSFLPAQTKSQKSKTPLVEVPLVGCPKAGQLGPGRPPAAGNPKLTINRAVAIKLAFYASSADFGVLAPRGWHCLDVGGSGGSWLFVSPIPIDSSETNSGPGVLVAWHAGGTSGRFQVAKLAARVFPAQAAFVKSVQDEDPRSEFPVGPYPADVLTYKSKTLVEYETPGMKEGLGTFNWLEKNGSPVYGAAILTNETSGTPDLVLISIRLPAQLEGLAPTIVQQIEQQIEHAVR